MRRRAVLALTAILVIIFLMQPIVQFSIVDANPFSIHDWNQTRLIIHSPISRNFAYSSYARPFVYNKPSFDISFEYQVPKNLTQVDSFSYKIDNSPIYSLNITRGNSVYKETYSVFETIDNLNDGIYNLKVFALFVNGTTSQIMDCTIKIDTMFADPYLPFIIASLAMIILIVSTVIFYGRKFIRKH